MVMREHCHLLIWPSEVADPSQIMQKLAERTANYILRTLHHNPVKRGLVAQPGDWVLED